MKESNLNLNEKGKLIEEIQGLMEERGRKPLEIAKEKILEEEIESKEVREALHFFMIEYWQDLARPTLLSICCEAVGGDLNATIPFAIPLSLISGALDIQDDIIDDSKTKHGRPTVYGKYGKEVAILTADALLFKGFTLLHEAYTQISKEKSLKIAKTIKNAFYELGNAEALELKFRGRLDITPKEYLRIVRKKAADVEAHAFIGGIIGNATKNAEKNLSGYGRLLGIAIILYDDWVDTVTPKEAIHRINKEHLPLPIIYAFQNNAFLRDIISTTRKNKMTEKHYKKIFDEVIKAGGFRELQRKIERVIQFGIKKANNLKNPENPSKFIKLFSPY